MSEERFVLERDDGVKQIWRNGEAQCTNCKRVYRTSFPWEVVPTCPHPDCNHAKLEPVRP